MKVNWDVSKDEISIVNRIHSIQWLSALLRHLEVSISELDQFNLTEVCRGFPDHFSAIEDITQGYFLGTFFRRGHIYSCGPGSSVGIATGYGMDGPWIESRWGAKFYAPVQTGPGAHPASWTMGTGSFPGVKRGRGVTLTPHPILVPWSRKGRAIPLLPLWAVRPVQSLSACTKVNFTFFTYTREKCPLASRCSSVCPSAFINSAPTMQIFVKLDIWLKSDKSIGQLKWRSKYALSLAGA